VVTVSNVLYTKTQSSGVARHFHWSDRKQGSVAYTENFHGGVSFNDIWWWFVFGVRSL